MGAWNWNYFTLESMCKAKCSLCDKSERPIIHKQEPLYNHIRDGTDDDHKKAFELIKNKTWKEIDWDEHYKTIQSTGNMLNPKVECNHCGIEMSIQGSTEIKKRAFLGASPKMKSHLKDKHDVDEYNWMPFELGIQDYAGYYCNKKKLGVIQVYTCEKCDNDDNEIRAKNGIMFVKHLNDKHRHDNKLKKFPWDKIPNE